MPAEGLLGRARAEQAERHGVDTVERADRAALRVRQLEAELKRLRAPLPPQTPPQD